MSLILEALRKSEAERRRGQVPNLHAERAPAALPARATRPLWPWLALATLAVLATAWLARGAWSPPPRAVDLASDTVAQSASANAAATEPSARDTGVGNRGAAAARQDRRAAARTPVDPPPLTSTPPSPRAANAATTALRESPAMPPRAAPAATPAPDANLAAGRIAPSLPSASVAAPPRAATAPTPAMASAVAPPAPATTPATATAAAPRRLSDLSTADRLELPPLKISMHLWDPTPAQRFAIIDGARVNEGDRLGDAVVDEITASAVVLAWRGQRLQIPLR